MVNFQFLTAVITKIVVLWDVALCSLAKFQGNGVCHQGCVAKKKKFCHYIRSHMTLESRGFAETFYLSTRLHGIGPKIQNNYFVL